VNIWGFRKKNIIQPKTSFNQWPIKKRRFVIALLDRLIKYIASADSLFEIVLINESDLHVYSHGIIMTNMSCFV